MEISDYFGLFLGGLMGVGPSLILWIAVIIFAVIMLRRGGGRAERFLVTGASLKIISNLLGIPASAIMIWLMHEGYNIDYANSVVSGYGIFCQVIGMAGIICLVYAFWVKFKTGHFGKEAALSQD
jgi:hypothetical protein